MSRHTSYGSSSKTTKKSSVLSRCERIALLIKSGQFKAKVTGLPKTLVPK